MDETTCPVCEKPIHVGEQIRRIEDAGGVIHALHPRCANEYHNWLRNGCPTLKQ